jgi:hypothetical protein
MESESTWAASTCCGEPRIVHVAVIGLRRALATASESLTLQEGLYRAYRDHLRDLDQVDGLPSALGAAIHDLVIDLRQAFGLDQMSGAKVAASTLRYRRATLLLARLNAIASNAEGLAEAEETESLH